MAVRAFDPAEKENSLYHANASASGVDKELFGKGKTAQEEEGDGMRTPSYAQRCGLLGLAQALAL